MQSEMWKMYVHWINERERIRRVRESGADKPWTEDEILRDYRFCNVNREHDKETIWIREHIREPYAYSESLWFNLMVARFVNWHPSLAELGYFEEWDAQHFKDTLFAIRDSGKKWGTSAYIVSTNGRKMNKIDYLADCVLTPAWEVKDYIPEDNCNCEDWADFFLSLQGCSNFMANQIVTDMRYTRYLSFADDWNTFVLPGPGTHKGLNYLFGRPETAKIKNEKAQQELMEVRAKLKLTLDAPTYRIFNDPNNIANSFCEFSKYARTSLGTGRPRAKYPGK